jgi:CheY-like chemotaxis protein/two-component sensor histidine kinase
MLAHELRNPLAPIAAAAELMRRPQVSAEQMRESSLIIARQAQHLRGLVDDLLDASRVSRGLIKLQWRELDLRELLYQALEQSHPLMQARGHQLHLKLATQALPVRGDAKRIVQVLSNMLNNAAKFTPPGGRVELSSRLDGSWVQVEVADSGIGMSEQTLASAFDLFAQGQISIDRQQGGLGIGLALVKKLAELHGGRVQAASEGLGCGSRLTISLPLAVQDAPVARAPAADPLKRQTAQDRRVLVVDDNVDAAQTLAMLLRTCGHACEVAHDAQQALALAAQSCPEVFILDIGLPGMDGRQLARHLREQPATQSAQIVALSGYAQPEDQQAALADGFDHYLVKPVDAQRLLELLAGD